ncbi:MAG: alanine racemase [Chloroflexota bacterium]|nr:alanine racemase [Chloroflexota bacterium]MDE2960682.1 alanine racemase [Chloroflexota bacterium]
MERPIFQPVGSPADELDTPALVVDLGIMEQNIAVLHDAVGSGAGRVAVRPHVSCHGCPEIAQFQLSAVNSAGGVAVSSLAEAEAFAAAGGDISNDDGAASPYRPIDDILIAGRVVTTAKINRLVALAGQITLSVAVDDRRNVQDLAGAAQAAGVTLGVLVDMDAGYGFGGVASVPDAVDLARTVTDASGLSLQGIMTYEGPLPMMDRAELEAETRRRLQPILDTRDTLEQAGIEVAAVSAGSTYNYDVVSQLSGITEVQAGVYPLMDMQTLRSRPEFQPAARILATVISHPVAGRAVVDAGHKTTGPDFGVPVLEAFEGAVATRFSAEHGILDLEGPATEQLMPNDKVRLVPHNLALCVNQYDYIRAVRDGKLVGYWRVAGRGQLG